MPPNSDQPDALLPHWDMTRIFPGLESEQFQQEFDALTASIGDLERLFDELKIEKSAPAPTDSSAVRAFEMAVNALNSLLERLRTIWAYIMGFVATNSRDNVAQAEFSELQQHNVQLSLLETRFTAWVGSLDVQALLAQSAVAREHAFMLEKSKIEAQHLMSPLEEELAAELEPSGRAAWARLHGNFTSQLSVSFARAGKTEELPMSMLRNLAYDPNRDVRRRAYEAELAAWKSASVPIAAALNSLKGSAIVLSKRRSWPSPLDMALFDNNIDRPTLDAMLTAAREAFPIFRRYLHAKAHALGLKALAWYDIFAPLPSASRAWSFEEGSRFIIDKFSAYSAKMGRLAQRAFDERWIDAEPRTGKRDGAFCMAIRDDESRVLANFKTAFSSVATLAHELGHAYHNVNLASRTMLQRQTPMTLAETASIFCQRMVTQDALKAAEPQEQIAILEELLQDACQVVVDITSRFQFEQNVFERRERRELSIDELNELMLQAQRDTYGDGLDPNTLHPYMWAAKQHYYQTNYYNYPYMFGLLFGLGLFSRFEQNPAKFKEGYDDLLASTGMADAAEPAGRFGIDLRTPDFWRASFAVIGRDVERYEMLVRS